MASKHYMGQKKYFLIELKTKQMDNDYLEGLIQDLESKVETLETKIDNLKDKVEDLESKVSDLKDEIEQLDWRVEPLEDAKKNENPPPTEQSKEPA